MDNLSEYPINSINSLPGQSFVLNLYDGVFGLVCHPYREAQKDGLEGFAKGVGRGCGGLVSLSLAAVFGLPGYVLKGIEKQLEKRANRDLHARLLRVRLMQGLAAFRRATEEEKEEILRRWNEVVTMQS